MRGMKERAYEGVVSVCQAQQASLRVAFDLQRFMQTALRRTRLPVAYSQGFNPHPVMSFASALAVGWTSDCEILDVRLSEPVCESFAFSQMASALPPDMPLQRVRLVDDRHPAMMALLRMAEYRIALAGEGAAATAAAIDGYMAEDSVIALRKTKSGEKPADIRAMTGALALEKPELSEWPKTDRCSELCQ